MKVLITGISGFVGAGVARHLLGRGIEVHGLVRITSNLWRISDIRNELILHTGDLLDKDSVGRALSKAKPDVVFHLAVYGAYPSQQDADLILSTSIISTMHLLNAAKAAEVKMFVNTGSSSEYGTKDHPMREDERIDPNSYYAVGKASQTLLCQHYARQEKFPVLTLRLFSAYGPYEEPGRLVPTVLLNALAQKEITLADPNIARDFIYIDDVAEAYYLAATKTELSGSVINIGTGVQHTLNELADIALEVTKSTSEVTVGTYQKRGFDTNIWVADTQQMESRLGFKPSYNLKQGIEQCVPWFQQHADYYKK